MLGNIRIWQHGRSDGRKNTAAELTAVADEPGPPEDCQRQLRRRIKDLDNAGSLIHSGCCDGVLIAAPTITIPP